MRHITLAALVLSPLSAPATAQGLITAPQQSLDGAPPPSQIITLPLAVDGDRMALHRSTFVREGGQWVPFEPLIGTTRAVAADGGTFVTGNVQFGQGIVRIQSPNASGWTLDASLFPSDPRQGLRFGAEVAISGDTVAVLTPGWRPVGQSAADAVGAVYVFRETASGWTEEALLTPAGNDVFMFPNGAAAIAVDGDTLVVTGRDAESATGGGSGRPAVHVMQRGAGGWSQVATLVLPLGAMDGGLGLYVDVQEDVPGSFASIAVHSSTLGRVYSGYGASWQSQDIAPGSKRGPVKFSGAVLAVADPVEEVENNPVAGSVHLYQRDSAGVWQFHSQLFPDDPVSSQYFGANLDLAGEWIGVASGAFLGNAGTPEASVDVFRVLPVGATEYCAGLPNSTGGVARIASSGTTSIAADDLELVAGPIPSGTGLFYYGGAKVLLPFGDGFRCVGSTAGIYRLRQSAVSNGLLTHELDFAAPPLSGGQILPGSTWNFQAWYRDAAAGGAGFNLSTGLELSFQP